MVFDYACSRVRTGWIRAVMGFIHYTALLYIQHIRTLFLFLSSCGEFQRPAWRVWICSAVSVSGKSTMNLILRTPVSPFFSKPKPGIVLILPGLMILPGLLASLNIRPLRWMISKSKPHNADFNGIVFSIVRSRCSTLNNGCWSTLMMIRISPLIPASFKWPQSFKMMVSPWRTPFGICACIVSRSILMMSLSGTWRSISSGIEHPL